MLEHAYGLSGRCMCPDAFGGSAAGQADYRLNVNKTKFYKLAKRCYPGIDAKKRTEFVKYPRTRDYSLDFCSGDGYHHLFLSVCGGRPTLGDKWSFYDEEGEEISRWKTRELTVEELLELGMMEELLP